MAELNTTHNHGLFSCCSVRLHDIISFFNSHKRLPVSVDSSKQFGHYKINFNDDTEDISKFLFTDPTSKDIPFIDIIHYHHEYQFSPYTQIDIESIQSFIEKYFNLSSTVLDRIQFLEQKYDIDHENTVAVLYRGNDKSTETTIGSYSDFINKCHEIYNNNKNIRFLIQTDEIEFRQEFQSIFPNSFFFDEIPAINKNVGMVVHHTITPEERPNFALNFLSSIKIISKCKHLVTHSGNCGLWAFLLRGNFDNVHQLVLHSNQSSEGWISTTKRKCVQFYSNNMGFADFIRGTICLKQICDRKNYDFFIERDSHDVFKFLEPNETIVSTNYNRDEVSKLYFGGKRFRLNDIFTIARFDYKKYLELYPDVEQGGYNTQELAIAHYLNYGKNENRTSPFIKGRNDSCIWVSTNCEYEDIQNENVNWGILPEKDKKFIKNILTPAKEIRERVKYIKENIYQTNDYSAIHVRATDASFDNLIGDEFYCDVESRISNLLQKYGKCENYVLFSTSESLCKRLINKFPEIKYWENAKGHMGYSNDINKNRDAITDYFLMSQAKKVFYISTEPHGTGFSESIHRIFDVEYERI